MTIGTVSTYAVFQSTLRDVSNTETELNKAQMKLSSGDASQDFGEMGGQTQQYLSLSATINRNAQYLNNHKVVEASVNTASSTLSQVISTATSLQSLLSQRITGVSNSAAFSNQIEGTWQTLAGQINTQVGGQYLFSGTKTNIAPVDPTTFPTLEKEGIPDNSYYKGSAQDMTTRIDENVSITYNVRADSPGFQKLIAGIVLAKQGDAANDPVMLQKAEDMVQDGLADITSLQAQVNANASILSKSDTTLTNSNLYWTGLQQGIGNTDIVAVSTQVAVNQGILQAAFQAFAKITALRLSDYLK